MLELLEYIRSQNMKGVMEHVVQRYGHLFEEVEYVATFKDFLLRHEQLQERSPDARPGAGTITAAAAAQQDAGERSVVGPACLQGSSVNTLEEAALPGCKGCWHIPSETQFGVQHKGLCAVWAHETGTGCIAVT